MIFFLSFLYTTRCFPVFPAINVVGVEENDAESEISYMKKTCKETKST